MNECMYVGEPNPLGDEFPAFLLGLVHGVLHMQYDRVALHLVRQLRIRILHLHVQIVYAGIN